jgi:hypothetical protein
MKTTLICTGRVVGHPHYAGVIKVVSHEAFDNFFDMITNFGHAFV